MEVVWVCFDVLFFISEFHILFLLIFILTFCDISRAFDRVWIRGLILKLKRQGIKDTLLRWLNSYLENRNQKVVLKDGISEAGNLRAGVPQGSFLGPLLFLVFSNNFVNMNSPLAIRTKIYTQVSM
jgi:hypothetical protein